MSSEQAQLEQQSKDAVIAYLQASSLQLEESFKSYIDWKIIDDECFNLDTRYYRIAHPKPWYRMAICKDELPLLACREQHEKFIESKSNFIRWLTYRVEYDANA